MDINDRINKIIEHENLSIAAFSRKIGVGDQTVRAVCVLKRNKPGFEFLSKIVQTFVWINPFWLLTGEGDMENKKCNEQQQFSNFNNLTEIITYLREKDKRIEELIQEKAELSIRCKMMERLR